jgi:PhnB protein
LSFIFKVECAPLLPGVMAHRANSGRIISPTRGGNIMASPAHETIISLMLAVPDTPAAVDWYQEALGASVLWSLGSVAGLEIDGAPFFLHQPVQNCFDSPKEIGTTTVRVELFVDEPDEVMARAVEAGATGDDIKNHITPWGTHRQGGFTDPFGHIWLVGDKSPLSHFRG